MDQLAVIMSLVEPDLKPHLIDRYLATAQKGGLAPVLCLNKADLVEHANLQPLVGFYSQLGIPTLLTSAHTGEGVDRLRELLKDRATVFSGQSGVGTSHPKTMSTSVTVPALSLSQVGPKKVTELVAAS